MTPGKIWGLRRMADSNGRFKMTAVDQRPPIKNLIKEKLKCEEAPWQDVAQFKKMLIASLQAESSAMLLDPHYAYPAGISVFNPSKGLVVTLEDSVFVEKEGERLSNEIDNWSVEKIKRIGGDAVKVLIWYRPDGSEHVKQAQQDFAKRTGETCARFDIPFLLELLVYPLPNDSHQTRDYVEMDGKKADHVLESVQAFATPDYNVDVFKLESPVNAKYLTSIDGPELDKVQQLFNEMGNLANRPWVMLSAGAKKDEFFKILTLAYNAGASGFLAGRAIWSDAFQNYPNWSTIEEQLKSESIVYMKKLNKLTDDNALPWHEHEAIRDRSVFAPTDGEFRNSYAGFGT